MNTRPLYQQLASLLNAHENCRRMNPPNNHAERHASTIDELTKQFMPSGSGIDCGTKFDWDESSCERQMAGEYPSRLVFSFSFHHMDESGGYAGWTDHKLIVRPSLVHEFTLKITGRDRNDVKEYLYGVFHSALSQQIGHDESGWFSVELREACARFKAGVENGTIC